jgi:hypothetical protein
MISPVETALASALIDHAARALAAADGYDWPQGKPAVQEIYRRQARVAVGACFEYMIENRIQVKP